MLVLIPWPNSLPLPIHWRRLAGDPLSVDSYLPTCLSVYQPVCLYISPSVCISARLSLCLYISPSVCLTVCISARLSVRPSSVCPLLSSSDNPCFYLRSVLSVWMPACAPICLLLRVSASLPLFHAPPPLAIPTSQALARPDLGPWPPSRRRRSVGNGASAGAMTPARRPRRSSPSLTAPSRALAARCVAARQ